MTPPANHSDSWTVVQRGFELRMSFGDDARRAQHAALHLDSGYLRLCPSPDSGWGTSVVLLPAFWSHGQLYQGAAVAVDWRSEDDRLLFSARGRIGLLAVDLEARISPPADGQVSARVDARAGGEVHLDRREGEAFRLVTLSSMRIDQRRWDAQSAYADGRSFALDQPGWIVDPTSGVRGSRFGLVGGTSDWKRNAPTVEVQLAGPQRVGGWLTESRNPSDDNVSLWCATPHVVAAWSYTIHAWRPAPRL